MNRRPGQEGGFSLIEVLLTVFILSVICLTLISVFVYGINLLAKTTQTNVATQIAQFEVERYRNMGFGEINTLDPGVTLTFQSLFDSNKTGPSNPYAFMFKKDGTNDVPVLRNGRETIVVQDGVTINMDPKIKKMTVTVEWDYRNRTIAGGDPMRKDVVTYFSKDGINGR